jgi:hypothetical protein
MQSLQSAIAIWLLLATQVAAREIYVDNVAGDDRRNGRTAHSQGQASGPCRTIAKALRIAVAGDRVILAATGEPYRESITVQAGWNSGAGDSPFEIIGNGAVLDGTVSLAEASWEYLGRDTFRVQPRRMSYQQLFLNDEPAVRKKVVDGKLPRLEPLEWCLYEGHIYFRVEPQHLPAGYDLRCCGLTVGITLYDVRDVVISDLTVRGFQLDGVNAHDNVRQTDLLGLTCIHNGRSGISVQNSSRVRIEACTAAGNGAAQIRQEDFSIVQLIDNQLDETTAPGFLRLGGKVK